MANRNKLAVLFVVPLALTLARIVAAGTGQTPVKGEKTFSGTVVEVTQQECPVCKCVELSLTLKTDAGTLQVRLGPKAFFEERDFFLLRGDLIKVSGFKFTEGGKDVILATEVWKAGDHVILRGKYGKPAWIREHGHTCPACGN
ncbi:MAG TPA: hypothetical protein VEU62_22475 [Bryobacterales bacterium]|nr:hypothetical protein [Bryobacterales bacterium]